MPEAQSAYKIEKTTRKMQMNNYTNDNIFAFLGFMVLLYLAGVVIYLLTEKNRERARYIKLEIKRNTGVRRRYWEEELKKHRLRSIPIIGKFISK